jgi:hypothetical protein
LEVAEQFIREPLIIINLSLPRMPESSDIKGFWIPAFAEMTFLEVAIMKTEPRQIASKVYLSVTGASRFFCRTIEAIQAF